VVEETGVPRENHRPVASHWQTSPHDIASGTPRLSGIRTHNEKMQYQTFQISWSIGSPTVLYHCSIWNKYDIRYHCVVMLNCRFLIKQGNINTMWRSLMIMTTGSPTAMHMHKPNNKKLHLSASTQKDHILLLMLRKKFLKIQFSNQQLFF
jgi:hypothetical protein